jgi:hypothetical protein
LPLAAKAQGKMAMQDGRPFKPRCLFSIFMANNAAASTTCSPATQGNITMKSYQARVIVLALVLFAIAEALAILDARQSVRLANAERARQLIALRIAVRHAKSPQRHDEIAAMLGEPADVEANKYIWHIGASADKPYNHVYLIVKYDAEMKAIDLVLSEHD